MKELEYTVIESDEQYYAYCNKLEDLLKQGLSDPVKKSHYKLLLVLIEDWDRKHNAFADMDPVQIIKSLLSVNNLKQNDLCGLTGFNKSYISEIMNYKKGMSKSFISSVASHFKIDESALNKEYPLVSKNQAIEMFNSHLQVGTDIVIAPPYESVNVESSLIATDSRVQIGELIYN
jgi:HTH-type transcriptional regulator/antitoxin HigA